MPTWQRDPYSFHGESTSSPFKNVRSFPGYPTLTYIDLHVISISQTGNNEPIGIPLPMHAGVKMMLEWVISDQRNGVTSPKFNG
jgi:hypothetical protein